MKPVLEIAGQSKNKFISMVLARTQMITTPDISPLLHWSWHGLGACHETFEQARKYVKKASFLFHALQAFTLN